MSALSAALLMFSFQFSLLFSINRSPGRTSTAAYCWFWYTISDNERCRKFGYVRFARNVRYSQGKDFELIPTVKIETRHPVQVQFDREFPAICNHYGVMAAKVARPGNLLRNYCVLEKRPLTVKTSKLCSKSFTALPIDVVVFKFREMLPRGNRRNRVLGPIYKTKNNNKISPASRTLATARIVPKICRANPNNVLTTAPDFIQIGLLLAEL